jgi:hypothetical protein
MGAGFAIPQLLLDAIEEDVTARFGDVEKADGAALQRRQARLPLARLALLFVGGIEYDDRATHA